MAAGDAIGSLGGYLTQNIEPNLKEKVRNGLARMGMVMKATSDQKAVDDAKNEADWKLVQKDYKSLKSGIVDKLVSVAMSDWESQQKELQAIKSAADQADMQKQLEEAGKKWLEST